MNYDTIKLLNLEDLNIDLEKSDIIKIDNTLYCNIVLTQVDESCPLCGSINYTTKDYRKKQITHSISTANPCILSYKARRYTCKDCSKIFYEKNPFASSDEKVSTQTRVMVLDALRSHTSTFSSVAKQYNLTVQTTINIFDSYVDCHRKRLPEIICMDEIYTSKLSNSSKYACVILDFNTKEIVEIYHSRHKFYLMNRFTEIPVEERSNVTAVVIDMWDTYRDLTRMYLRNAIVAVDSFHVIKHLNDAIIKIRIKTMRKYDKKKDKLIENDMYYYMLKKFHYFFTKDYESIYKGDIRVYKINSKWKKDEILKYLLSIDKDLSYAYYLKERYREFNLTADYESCDEEFHVLINEFLNSHLEEYREFGRLLTHWKTEIKNSFIRVNGRRLSNGAMEGTNSRLKCIIKNANGYKKFIRFRNRCIFSINKNAPILGNPSKKSTK
jgi:transposase